MPALAPEKLKTLNVGRIAKFKIASTSKETIVAANMAPIHMFTGTRDQHEYL